MSNDVLITPASRKIEFKDSSANVDAKIETDASGNLLITNTGGDISIGDTSSDIFVGDGTNNIDIVFEQNGEIRGTSGVTITLGASGSNVTMASDLNLNSNDITNASAITSSGVITASGGNSGNWNTAHGWGNHASQSYITNSTASLNANKITSGLLGGDRIATGSSGDWWSGNAAKVETDGVMEVGKYIDFHNTDTSTSDFDTRLESTGSSQLSINGSGRLFTDGYHPNADTWTTARTITLGGDLTGNVSINGSANVTLTAAVVNDSHTHAFNNLTGKTSATGEYSTSGYLTAGRGSGGVSLTHNDGYGNANVTFNHKTGVPEQDGNSARIEVNTDSGSDAQIIFGLNSGVTSGTAAEPVNAVVIREESVDIRGTLRHAGDDNTYLAFNTDRVRLVAGGVTKFDSNNTYLTSHQSLSGYATESYVGTQISNLVDSSPAALNTLNELAAALGDDASFSTTVNASIAAKLPLAGGTMTGALNTGSNAFGGSYLGVNSSGVAQWGADRGIMTWDTGYASIYGSGTNVLKLGGHGDQGRITIGDNVISLTAPLTTNSTIDGVDIAARNTILTSTTTTANAALPKAGGTMTGTLNMGGNAFTGNNFNISGVNQISLNDPGEGIVFGANCNLYLLDDAADNILRLDAPGGFRLHNGPLSIGTTTVIDSNRNLTNIGTINSGAITAAGTLHINQADDSNGIKIFGYDDRSAYSGNIYLDSAGNLQIRQTHGAGSGYIQMHAETYLELGASGLVYTSSQFRIYDAGSLSIGSGGDYKIKHNVTADNLIIHTDDNKGITIDNAGNVAFSETVTVTGTVTATTTADATPAIIATNTGGVNGVIQRWIGDSDSMEFRNMDTGDYELMNTQQNNGIVFRDGTGGVEIHYNGNEIVEVGSLGGLVLVSGDLQIPNALVHKDDSDTSIKFDLNRVRIFDGGGTYLDTNNGSAVLHTSTTFGGDVSGTYGAIVVNDDSHFHHRLDSTDDRDMKPSSSGITTSVQAIKPFFSSYGGMTGTANTTYVDVLAFDTYSDSSGGGPSAITFKKGNSAGDPEMHIWHAGWGATTWSTGQRVFADNYHPNADTLTTARTIAGTSFNGSANIDISYNNLTNKPTIPSVSGLAPIADPTFTGDLNMPNKLRHDGDTNTYIQFHAADEFRVVTGGSQRLEVNNDNTTVANRLLSTYSGTSAHTLQNATTNGTVLTLTSTADNRVLSLQTDHVFSNGTMVFGDNSHVTYYRGSTHNFEGGSVDIESKLRHRGDTDNYINFSAADTQSFVTGNSTRFQITNSLVRFNQEGVGQDFQVYGANDNNLIFADASADKVGIGTSAPISKLVVLDTTFPQVRINDETNGGESGIRFRSKGTGVDLHGDIFVDGTGTETGRMGFRVPWNATEKMTILNSGNVGIGATSPSEKLHIHSGGVYSTPISYAANADGWGLKLGASNNAGWDHLGIKLRVDSTGSPRMALMSTGSVETISIWGGKVGIGTNAPAQKLDVQGTILVNNEIQFTNDQMRIYRSSDSMKFRTGSSDRLTISSTGDATLAGHLTFGDNHDIINVRHVRLDAGAGNAIKFWDSTSYQITMASQGTSTYGRVAGETTSDYNMYFRMTSGTNRGFVFQNGTANNVAGIDSLGNARFKADVIAYTSSDKRLKDNITRISNPMEKINKLSGNTFEWNDNQDTYEKGMKDVGVIAQEVEEVLPEIVETRDNGYKAVKYEKMVALLIEGMKEQQEQIEKLEKQIQELKEE